MSLHSWRYPVVILDLSRRRDEAEGTTAFVIPIAVVRVEAATGAHFFEPAREFLARDDAASTDGARARLFADAHCVGTCDDMASASGAARSRCWSACVGVRFVLYALTLVLCLLRALGSRAPVSFHGTGAASG